MANGLSTEQKHDLVKAGLQASPAGKAGVGASMEPVTESAFLGFAGLCAVLTLRAARWFLEASIPTGDSHSLLAVCQVDHAGMGSRVSWRSGLASSARLVACDVISLVHLLSPRCSAHVCQVSWHSQSQSIQSLTVARSSQDHHGGHGNRHRQSGCPAQHAVAQGDRPVTHQVGRLPNTQHHGHDGDRNHPVDDGTPH